MEEEKKGKEVTEQLSKKEEKEIGEKVVIKKNSKKAETENPAKEKKLFNCNLNQDQKKMLVLVIIVSLISGVVGSIFGAKISDELKIFKKDLKSSLGISSFKINENSAIIDAVDKVSPSVVSITSEQSKLDFFGQVSKSKSSGTGFIISKEGLIITNKHVVSDEKALYSVFTSDGKEYKAEIKSKDSLNDIAFLKIDGKDLKPVEIGSSDDLKIGQQVVAIGNALGQYQNTVTAGIVSAKGRAVPVGDSGEGASETLENVIQTDAAINPGNSGGPLINLGGQVVGINTAIDSSGQGIGFAIPIDMVRNVIKSVEETGKIVRPYIGVRYIPITKEFASRNNIDETYGVLVYGNRQDLAVVPGSPADKAGIDEGDIILEINGKKIDKDHTLTGLLQSYEVGDTVKVLIVRENEKKTLEVKLAESR